MDIVNLITFLILILLFRNTRAQFSCFQNSTSFEIESQLPIPSWCNVAHARASIPRLLVGIGNPLNETDVFSFCESESFDATCRYVTEFTYIELNAASRHLVGLNIFGDIVDFNFFTTNISIPRRVVISRSEVEFASLKSSVVRPDLAVVVVGSGDLVQAFEYREELVGGLGSLTELTRISSNGGGATGWNLVWLEMVEVGPGEVLTFVGEQDMSVPDSDSYRIRFFLTQCSNSSGGCGNLTLWKTWSVRTTGNGLLQLTSLSHLVLPSNVTTLSKENLRSMLLDDLPGERTLIVVLSDAVQVHLFPISLFNSSDRQIDFSSSVSTCFFRAPPTTEITALAVSTDRFLRVLAANQSSDSFAASECLSDSNFMFAPSQGVTLHVALLQEFSNEVNFSVVAVVDLEEFRNLSATLDIENAVGVGLCLTLGSTTYWNGFTCVPRSFPLTRVFEFEAVTSLRTSFAGILQTNPKTPESIGIDFEGLCGYVFENGLFESHRELFRECITLDVSAYDCDLQVLQLNPNLRRLVFGRFWQTHVYVSTRFLATTRALGGSIHVMSYGYVSREESSEALSFWPLLDVPYFQESSVMQLPGREISVVASTNSFYVWMTLERKRWELLSLDQLKGYCLGFLEGAYDDLYLSSEDRQAMAGMCLDASTHAVDGNFHGPEIGDFVAFVSACPEESLCPSFERPVLARIEDGLYAPYPWLPTLCDPGFTCWRGRRKIAPVGTYAPLASTFPTLCSRDESWLLSCYDVGEVDVDEQACPLGFLCPTRYSRFPIPPGFKQELSVDSLPVNYFSSCNSTAGDWCPLAAPLSHFTVCPPAHFCNSTAVLVPERCAMRLPDQDSPNGYSDYCPMRTNWQQPCPAGYFCQIITKDPCEPGMYCPAGSFAPTPCPGGSFCETPSSIEECPFLYYCPVGSTRPRSCGLFNPLCTPGSQVNRHYLQLVAMVLIFPIVWAISRVYLAIVECVRSRGLVAARGVKVEATVGPLPITLGCEDLKLTLKSDPSRVVVNEVTGQIPAGKVTAVMGSSGCGKTSFITALDRAFYGVTTGKVTVNGVEMSLRELKKLVCFVPQEDIMLRTMTVEETLFFSARTRLPPSTSNRTCRDIVTRVMEMLSLTEIRSSLIGDENVRGISGGQRKRVNVGMELAALPSILFLDEPTSGLDATSSMEMANCLRELASTGINVICVIHQPRFEIFSKMDNLLLLGKGGSTVYYGSVSDSVAYFENLGFEIDDHVNPADFFLDAVAGLVKTSQTDDDDEQTWNSEDFAFLWNETEDSNCRQILHEAEAEASSIEDNKEIKRRIREQIRLRRTPHLEQFIFSLRRGLIGVAHDLGGHVLGIAFLLIIGGMIVGFLFQGAETGLGDIMQQTQMFTLILCLCVVMAALPTFGRDRAVFIRENSSGLNAFWHFLALNVVEIPAIVIAPLAFTTVHFFLASPLGNYMFWYSASLGVSFATFGLGYIISMLFASSAMVASIVFVMGLSIFAGLVVSVAEIQDKWNIPLNYLPYVAYVRYCSEALFVVEAKEMPFIPNLEEVVMDFGYNLDALTRNLLILLGFGVSFRVVAFFCLISLPPYSLYNRTMARIKSLVAKLSDCIHRTLLQKGICCLFSCCCCQKQDEDEESMLGEEEEIVLVDLVVDVEITEGNSDGEEEGDSVVWEEEGEEWLEEEEEDRTEEGDC